MDAELWIEERRLERERALRGYSVRAVFDTLTLKRKRGSMRNVTAVEENGMLVIRIDPTKEFGQSESGKTIIVASTGRAKPVGSTPGGRGIISTSQRTITQRTKHERERKVSGTLPDQSPYR